MAYDNNRGGDRGGFAPRQMFDVDVKCSNCGAEIKQLPFQPSGDRPIYCRDCHAKMRPPRQNRY